MDDYSELMARLDSVERELMATPSDDFAGKHRLHTERDALTRLIRDLQGDVALTDDRPTDEIQREIVALMASADAIRRDRPNRATQASSGNSAGDGAGVMLYERSSQASGYAAIQQRIGQLESTLEKRSARD